MGKETDVILELEISGDPDEKILDVGGLKPEGTVAYTTLETWHVETVIAPRPSRVWRGNLKKKNRREAQELLSLDATTIVTIPQPFGSLIATSTHLYQSGIAFTAYQDADHR